MIQLKVNSIVPQGGLPSGSNGGIIQVKSTIKTNTFSTNSTSTTFTAVTGLSVAITPSTNNNKILIIANVNLGTRGDSQAMLKLKRGSTDICVGDADGIRIRCACEGHTGGTNHGLDNHVIQFLDSPGDTNEQTYQVFMRVTGNTHYINRTNPDDNETYQSRVPSTITAYEVSV